MKIVVVGLGYVGLSLAVLLAQHNEVKALEISSEKVELINDNKSPIFDKYISEYLTKPNIKIDARTESQGLYSWADFIIIATPTNYDPISNKFDTSSIEAVVGDIVKTGSKATVVIKSTIPIGYTESLKKKSKISNLLFSPEFLREGKALEDNLFPSRIIVGLTDNSDYLIQKATEFGNLLNDAAIKKTSIIIMNSKEAESVKLFSNTFLATRVAFFNELDTYAELNGLDASKIIHGMCMDPRIGDFYNNPSFGYGGYCLPKDTKQLKSEFINVPNNIIDATVAANETRANYISQRIIEKAKAKSDEPIIGIYRLIMKADSDNFRSSSIQNIINNLKNQNIKMLIYEPTLNDSRFAEIEVIKNFDEFKEKATIIVANRKDDVLANISEDQLYTRDIYGKN